ncbi:MAG: hypothetical protein ABWY05_06210 [Noviherbaspirillum sp.]
MDGQSGLVWRFSVRIVTAGALAPWPALELGTGAVFAVFACGGAGAGRTGDGVLERSMLELDG